MIRRVGLWVLLAMFLLVAGCTVIVAALVGEAAEDNDRREAEALTQVSCAVVGVTALGDVEVDVTADNTTSKRSDYFVEFELRDGSYPRGSSSRSGGSRRSMCREVASRGSGAG
jgi:hypothetical protein